MTRRLLFFAPVAALVVAFVYGEVGAHLLGAGAAASHHELLYKRLLMDVCPIRRVYPGEPVPPRISTEEFDAGTRIELALPDATAARDAALRGLEAPPGEPARLRLASE